MPIVFTKVVRQKLRSLMGLHKPLIEDDLNYKNKILSLKSQIQDDISEMSSEKSHDS